MLSYTKMCVVGVIFIIFGAIHVTCSRTIKEECVSQINRVFQNKIAAYDCMKYAMKNLKNDMPLLITNFYARRYNDELKNYLTKGDVVDPRTFWTNAFGKTGRKGQYKYIVNHSINELTNNFGIIPKEIVQHAYTKEVLNEDDSSFKSNYMEHIIDEFGIDNEVALLYPSNFCEKEQAEFLCRYQINSVFRGYTTAYGCMYYAMSNLRQDYLLLLENAYALEYYNALATRLNEDGFLENVEDPATFFGHFLEMTEDPIYHNSVINATNEILVQFGGNKLAFVVHVYKNEVINVRDNSFKQHYVRHICQRCGAQNFRSLINLSPDKFCQTVRDHTNEQNLP